MKLFVRGLLALTLMTNLHNICAAETLKSEPPKGTIKPGKTVFVDDGSCGNGMIKRIIAGNSNHMNAVPRSIQCVPKK